MKCQSYSAVIHEKLGDVMVVIFLKIILILAFLYFFHLCRRQWLSENQPTQLE